MLRWKREEFFKKGYFWIPFFIIMCPTFPSIIGFGNQIVFVLNIFLLLLMGLIGCYKWRVSWSVVIYGGYFIGIACWDVLLEMVRDDIGPSDFLEILRPIGFFFCYLYYRTSVLPIDSVEQQTLRMIYVTFTVICIYCIMEFIFPEQVRELSFFLWKRKEVPILKNKAIGPFFQTYNSAYALLIPLFWGFISMFRGPKPKNIIFFVLCLLTLLLTQSRSMYMCGAVGLAICVLIATNFKSSKSVFRTCFIFALLIAILLSLYFLYEEDIKTNLSYAFQGLEAMSQGNSTSLNSRQEQVAWAFDNNLFPVIGFGIGKGEILLESIYALYYYRYGVVGLLIFGILTFYSGYASFWISKRMKNEIQCFYQALTVFFLMNPMALSSSCHQDMPKTCLLFYGMVGMVFSRYAQLRKAEKVNNFKCSPEKQKSNKTLIPII